MNNTTFTVTFLPKEEVVQASQGQTLLAIAIENKISIEHSCGGNGTCGSCLVHIKGDLEKLSPRNEIEQEMAIDRRYRPDERLACQIEVNSHFTVEIPK